MTQSQVETLKEQLESAGELIHERDETIAKLHPQLKRLRNAGNERVEQVQADNARLRNELKHTLDALIKCSSYILGQEPMPSESSIANTITDARTALAKEEKR